MKYKGDLEIGYRAAEEARRIFKRAKVMEEQLGIGRQAVSEWGYGITPGGYFLAKLHYAGADVIYILTGKRSKEA